jgi:hypothetical protein
VITAGIDQPLPVCDEPCISCARTVGEIGLAANRMSNMAQPAPSPRFRSFSFWQLQLGGWLLYAAAVTASMFSMRDMRGNVAYHAAFVLSGFLLSFVMYGVCHALWRAQVPLIRALFTCTVVAYGLGILVSGASVWAELRFSNEQEPFHWNSLFLYATGSCFVLAAWAFLYFGIKHYQGWEEEKLRLQALEVMARDAQMRALRYQLQPHFLFNTLNAISTLVLDNQPRIATQMIARLADLLRRTLEAPDVHQVSLQEEIAVTKEYLALEKVRFGPRLSVTFEIDPETHEALVPRFLLQPLVENAVRHGIAKRPDGGNLILHSELAGGRLRVRIENDGAEDDEPVLRRNTASPHRGVGLTNTRARLEQMYGHEATLETHATANGTYEVRISMPFSTVEALADAQMLEVQ